MLSYEDTSCVDGGFSSPGVCRVRVDATGLRGGTGPGEGRAACCWSTRGTCRALVTHGLT